MSAFYDLASLVLVPSGYKASKVYAQKPLTTDGQLTFSRASTATRVNSAGLIETVSSNVPRLDYQGSTCPKLLLEPQRTNLVTYSEQFDNAVWSKDNTTVTSGFVSPTGYANAFKLTEQATNAVHSVYQSFPSISSSVYTASAFVKKGERFKCSLADRNTGAYVSFNLNTGTIIASGTFTGKIEAYGNDWYRITVTSASALTVIVPQIFVLSDSYTTGLPITLPYVGDGTSGIYIWGAQLEAGAYATSYIPTLEAAVTRAADNAVKTGISSLISASEYTLFYEGSHIPTGQYNSFATLYNNSVNGKSARFYRNNTDNQIYAAAFIVGNNVALGSGVTSEYVKCAFRLKSGDYALYVNGSLVASSTSSMAPASDLDAVNLQYFNNTQAYDQKTEQVLFFKSALTNAQLAELTTL